MTTMDMEEATEPPGTEVEFAENDTQPLAQDEIADESAPASQEVVSPEHDGTDPNSSFDKGSPSEQHQKRSRSRRSHSSKRSRSHKKRHSGRHSKRSSRQEVAYEEDYLFSPRGERGYRNAMASAERDAEDGEILEDGEIASDDGAMVEPSGEVIRSMEDDDDGPSGGNSDGDEPMGEQIDQPAADNEEGEKAPKPPRPRRDNKRKRKDKRTREMEKRKKLRRPDYFDHDRVDEDGGGRWAPYQGGPDNDDFYHSPSKRREARDLYYYNGGDSPPGLYDSPSEDSDEDPASQPSLTSLVSDEFLDASVEANEKERLKVKGMKMPRERKRIRAKRRDGRHFDPPKKKLVEIPMADRPVCKFYKDGKCAKGANCPFNHDALRNKRLEVCKYHLMQTGCNKGDNCIYMHEDFPCKYFHTGQTCFSGEKCRFSHEPLTEETKRIVEEMMNPGLREEGVDTPDRPKKPSLLGSPPRHIKEAVERAKEIKKIPSLFDIEVFPPGQKPPKPTGFYSERGDSSSPPPEGSPPRPTQGQGPMSSSPGPSLLGSPAQNNVRGPNPGGMMQQGPTMMGAGPQGPMNRPMMGPQRPMFGMQQGGNPNMQPGMNPNMQPGMNPGMQQGMGPRMQQGMGMNQGMNHGMNQAMNPGANPGGNPGMNPGGNPGMNPGMDQNPNAGGNPNMSQGMPQGMNVSQGMPQGMNMSQSMPQGMNVSQSMPQGMNQNVPQGMNHNLQPGVNQGMPQGMNMNQGMPQRMQNPGMQQGMNPGMMQQGMNPGMQQQGMNQNQPGMNPMQGMNMNQNQPGLNPGMRGMNPNMVPGMNRMMNPNMPGIPAARFGMGAQTTSSMPPVLNMISALLRGASGTASSFNQNGPQGPLPNQGPMPSQGPIVPQDTDMRVAGDTDMRIGAPGPSGPDPRNQEQALAQQGGLAGNAQDPVASQDAASAGAEGAAVSPSQAGQDRGGEQAAGAGPSNGRDKGMSPQYGEEAEGGKAGRLPGGESSEEEEGALHVQDAGEGSQSPPPLSQSFPAGAVKTEGEEDGAAKSPPDKSEDMDKAMHLPPKQRQLFMRILHQQHNARLQAEEEAENKGSASAEDDASQPESKMEEDDNWYSSDEDETGVSKKKLTDILKNITKTSVSSASGVSGDTTTPAITSTSSQPTTSLSSSTASVIDVMQMIQSIRSQAQTSQPAASGPQSSDVAAPSSTTLGASSAKDPRQRLADPRSSRSGSTTPASVNSKAPSSTLPQSSMPLPTLPTLFVDPPVTDGMPKKTLVYRMTPLSVRAVKPYWSLPPAVDPEDPERKKDPRIQAHITLVEKRGPETKVAPLPAKTNDPRLSRKVSVEEGSGASPRPHDPRMRRSGGGKDPRVGLQDPRSQNAGSQDPRSQSGAVPQDLRSQSGAGPQDPRSQNMGLQDPRSQNMGPQGQGMPRPDPRMQNVPGQEPWIGNNMGGGPGGMMGPGGGGGGGGVGGGCGMNMMPGSNNMGPGFQGNMMQGPRGMMPGQGDMWNAPMRMPMNMPQGPMGMQQGPMNMPQGPMNMPQGPMNMPQVPMNMQGGPMGMNQGPMKMPGGPMNMQGGPMNMQGGPMNMQGGPMNMQQGPMGMQDPRRGPMNMQGGPMGMPQGNMGMPQGNMGMQQGNMGMQQGMQQGNMGIQQGNMGMPQGIVGMQQGNVDPRQGPIGNQHDSRQGPMGNPQDPRQGPMGSQQGPAANSDPRQPPSMLRGSSDPRQRGQVGRGDPREGRPAVVDPRMVRLGQEGAQGLSPVSSPHCSDTSVSPPRQPLLEDPFPSRPDPSDGNLPHGHSDGVGRDSDTLASPASFPLPPALREPPARSEPDAGASDDGSASEDGSAAAKKRFDHRNDPRFKRKRVAESKGDVPAPAPAESIAERTRKFMGQRKSTMEYTSPLGGGDDDNTSTSGYNSYNRPPQGRQDPRKRKAVVSKVETPFELPRMELPPLLSQQPPPLPENMAPPKILPEEPEQQLKDVFKTIDPTASPFC